jgi:hypothetical protein
MPTPDLLQPTLNRGKEANPRRGISYWSPSNSYGGKTFAFMRFL